MRIDLRLGDCLELIKQIPDKSVDLIVTDPPYELVIEGGGGDRISKSTKGLGRELSGAGIADGFDDALLPELERVCKVFNAYIWCSRLQLPKLLDYFVTKRGYMFQVLIWHKTNPIPANNNTYLNDKEYCLYFRNRGGGIFSQLTLKHLKVCGLNQSTQRIKKHGGIQQSNRLKLSKHLFLILPEKAKQFLIRLWEAVQQELPVQGIIATLSEWKSMRSTLILQSRE